MRRRLAIAFSVIQRRWHEAHPLSPPPPHSRSCLPRSDRRSHASRKAIASCHLFRIPTCDGRRRRLSAWENDCICGEVLG